MESPGKYTESEAFKKTVQTIAREMGINEDMAVEVHTGPDFSVIHILFDSIQENEVVLMAQSIKGQYNKQFSRIEIYHEKQKRKIKLLLGGPEKIQVEKQTLQQVDIIFSK